MIAFDPHDAQSMAAACRALADELESLRGKVSEGASNADDDLLRLLPLLCLTRSLDRALLLAVALRNIATRLDAVPSTVEALRAAMTGTDAEHAAWLASAGLD